MARSLVELERCLRTLKRKGTLQAAPIGAGALGRRR
jgi:hypothetical protein